MNDPASTSERTESAGEPTPPQRLTVTGVSASEDGLRALQGLFGALPDDTGMAFVVTMHPLPEHENSLAKQLKRHTEMPVIQVTERVDAELEPDHVYVIPPGKRLVAGDTHLSLAEHHGDGVVVTCVDIRDNRESELALREAKEYAKSIVDTVPDSLLVLDTDLRVRTANEAFCQTFQVNPDETEGQLVYDLGNSQWDIPELRTLLEEVLPNDKIFTGYEVEHEFEEIGRRTMLLNGRQLDHVQLILLGIADITERKEAERQVRELNEMLEAQVADRSEQIRSLVTELTMSEQKERRRISGILHDSLQQRLYSLQFQLASLRDRLDSEDGDDISELFDDIIDGIGEELDQSIQTTRNLSADLNPPVQYGEGLTATIAWLATRMEKQYGLTIDVRAEDDLPVASESVRVILFQIVRELLFNVVKHAGVAEAVVVLTGADGGLHVEVIDQGEGFDVEVILSDLVQSYGLEQSQRRLELIGGSLQVESNPGEGTRVILYCPLDDGAES